MDLAEDFSSWNPMKDDFENEGNTYENVLKPDLNQMNNQFELFVSGIPLKISKDGLLNLFSNEGKISTDIFLSVSKNSLSQFGIVKACSYYDAVKIIEQYNGFYIGDHKLSIKFSKNHQFQQNKKSYSSKFHDDAKRCHENKTSMGRGIGMINALADVIEYSNNTILPGSTSQTNKITSNAIDPIFKNDQLIDDFKFNKETKIEETKFKPKEILNISGTCIYCHKQGSKRCSKCKSIYCSKFCQNEHWKTHKLTCNYEHNLIDESCCNFPTFLPDSLIKKIKEEIITSETEAKFFNEMRNKVSLEDLEYSFLKPGQSYEVAISCDILSPNQIFFIPIMMNTQLEEFSKEMTKFYKRNQNGDLLVVEVGDVCACEFAEDERWYRAVVIRTEEFCAEVQFLDYGNIAEIPWNKLAQLDQSFIKTPLFAIEGQIVNCKPANNSLIWPNEAKIYLRELLPSLTLCNISSYGTCVNNIVTYVSIHNLENINISDIMVKNGFADVCTLEEHINWHKLSIQELYLSQFGISPESEICITFINNPNDFYFINFNSQQKLNFKKLHKELEIRCVEYNIIPLIGDTIIASYKNTFYRALVKDVSTGGQIKVYFMDFGNEEFIMRSDVKALLTDDEAFDPDKLPGLARRAMLANNRGAIKNFWTAAQISYFKSKCEVQVYRIGNVSIGGGGVLKVQLIDNFGESIFSKLKLV